MKRRWTVLCLCTMLCMATFPSAYSYGTPKHEQDYERVLFGKILTYAEKDNMPALRILEMAVYLTVDSFDYRGADELAYLQAQGVPRLPDSIDGLSFTGNQYHERYTHMGWETHYIVDKAGWDKKRKIMFIASVNKALDFGFGGWLENVNKRGWITNDESAFSPKCRSFAALLYYVHLLGDHVGNTYRTGPTRMPLGHLNAGPSNRDVMHDLIEHLDILFRDQKNSIKYKHLRSDLETKAAEIRELAQARITEDKYSEYQEYAKEVLAILEQYVPDLLKNESFFANVFYK